MSAPLGIWLYEEPGHRHDASCRQPCEICEFLYPPRDLVDWICAACWREYDAMVRAYDQEDRTGDLVVVEHTVTPERTLAAAGIDDARQAEYQRKLSALLAGR